MTERSSSLTRSSRLTGRLPLLGRLIRERNSLREEVADLRARGANHAAASAPDSQFVPPGHFYSPIPSLAKVREDAKRIFAPPPRTLPGIDLRESEQLALLDKLQSFYDELEFPAQKSSGFRFYYENPMFSYSDAVFLYCMIRHLRPRRYLEIGSGFSSAAALDTIERHLRGTVECTFVEPFPERLRSLLAPGDERQVVIVSEPAEKAPPEVFAQLQQNDILFIDSTHVSKCGSDVNFLLLEVLPRLASGVHVHIHDIQYPFEYPLSWIEEGRAWNEAYLVRAFLAFNDVFEVVLMNDYLERFHEDRFATRMPLCLRNRGGSLWLRKC